MSHNYTPQTSIVIPLKNTAEDEIIEISFDDLPDGEEVLQILKGERAALHFWLDLALEYYKAGLTADFIRILEQSGTDAGLDYHDYEKDQTRALDMLAAHYVLQGNNERDKEKKKEWYSKATLLYTTADRILMYDQNHLLGRAYFCLLEGGAKLEQADAQFNFVLNQPSINPSLSIPAMMGKACIAFNKKDYKTALFYYKKCLRVNPNCPADVRVGIGYCLSRQGKYEKARLAFERALELDPNNMPATIALAVLDLNTMEPEHVRSGIQALGRAYQNDPENPMVLNHLSNHFFYKNDLDKAEQLAWHSFQISERNEAMRAESCYHLARCFHKRKDYDKASRYYYQSTQYSHPRFILPHFGLGQIYILREDFDNAIASFEKILKVVPNNYETMKILGSLYAQLATGDQKQISERQKKARELLKKVSDMCPEDVEVLLELAQLQEQADPQASLNLYQKAADVLQEHVGMDVPPEIQNNIGALYFILGDHLKAKQNFESAKQFIEAEGENMDEEMTATLITTSYNLGRANEALCLFDDAENLYRNIVRHRPNYMDCILRLGCLVRDKGDTHNASLLFKESLSLDPNNPGPWSLIGNMHMAKSEYGPAQKKFEHILKNAADDAYSLVALGNVWLETLFNSRQKEKEEKQRQTALAFYVRALKFRPKNIWAANGIGCVLAHKGEALEARDIFAQVREATVDFADVWTNIAHIYMEQKQYVSALQMYRNCMVKFKRYRDVELLMYIARAYWKAGKFAECRDHLEKAAIEAPDNLLIRFDQAVVLQKMANHVLQDQKSSLAAVEGAVQDLKIAETIFKHIAGTTPEVIFRFKYISRTICGQEAQHCSDFLKQAQIYLQRAQAKDEEERRQREMQEQSRLALHRQKEEEERKRQEEIMRKIEELKETRQSFVDKTKEILKLPQIVDEKKPRAAGGGGRKKREQGEEFVNDSSDLGEYNGEPGERPRKKLKGEKRRRRERRQGSVSSEEGGDREQARLKKKKKRVEQEEVPARMRGKIKSRAFLSSSEDSDSDAGGGKQAAAANSDDSSGEEKQAEQRSASEAEQNNSSENADSDVPTTSEKKAKRVAVSESSEAEGGQSDGEKDAQRNSSEGESDAQAASPAGSEPAKSDEEVAAKSEESEDDTAHNQAKSPSESDSD
ncbi:hypothetical protein AAVH_02602 [Aphelenchoides avenae]|nr:hypothetical protein AAVH_02602 [Aphelenchus avenae]